jgi:hypothetical protein
MMSSVEFGRCSLRINLEGLPEIIMRRYERASTVLTVNQ